MQSRKTLLTDLTNTVQQNCHIADALYAGDYTLCIYLLKMRELYRWEQNKTFSANLSKETVGNWLRRREALWHEVESSDYQHIQLNEQAIPPFESGIMNRALAPHQLVYSAGMGLNNRPHFFLAELEHYEKHDDYALYIAGKEYARDMSAPPAMSHDKTIYIRKESFQRFLWEQLETWRWNKADNALGRAFACYDCDNDLDNALMEMTDTEIENVIQHERGEIEAGIILGDEWQTLLFSLPYSKATLMLRAIRDHLADSLTTLPFLLEINSAPSWHFYFGNLNNMRKDLYPELKQAYDIWYETGSLRKMQETISHGKQHWLTLCQDVLQIKESDIKTQQTKIEHLIEQQRL